MLELGPRGEARITLQFLFDGVSRARVVTGHHNYYFKVLRNIALSWDHVKILVPNLREPHPQVRARINITVFSSLTSKPPF